jgi:hypothetical protein
MDFRALSALLLQTYAWRQNGVKQHEETLIAGIRQVSKCAKR